MRRRYGAPSFTRLVRTYPYGTDPTLSGLAGHPSPLANTVRFGVIGGEGGRSCNARLSAGVAGVAPSSGSFVVADNDFSTGLSEIVLGEHRLISNVDFIPGGGVNATAAAIAASIRRLVGFSATSNLAVVTVTWEGPFDEVDFYALHYGTINNFTPFNPGDGYMATGRPAISAPEVVTP